MTDGLWQQSYEYRLIYLYEYLDEFISSEKPLFCVVNYIAFVFWSLLQSGDHFGER